MGLPRTGRPNRIHEPEFAKRVAELYVSGLSFKELGEELDAYPDTVRLWVKNPLVASHARRYAQERVLRITRKIDGELEGRLAHAADMDTRDLLSIRKEYLDRPLNALERSEGADPAKITNELADAIDGDPVLAQKMMELSKAALETAPQPKE